LSVKNVNPKRWVVSWASLVLVFALIGCDRKTDANTELDKAAREMQKADTAPTPAAPAVPVAEAQSRPAAPAAPPAQEMNQAVAAYKAGQVEDAVTRLQRLRATPTLTPEQRIALNDAMAAVMSEISAQAAKGDSKAIEALKQYDKMQTERR
jgi:hypothetical protein